MADYKHYQLRVHRPYDDIAISLLQFSDKSQTSFAFEHPEDDEVKRTHIHYYCFNMTIRYDAITARLQKLDLKGGNTDFSVLGTCGGKKNKRPLDISGAWVYGSECGTLAPKWVNNLSPHQVEELQVYARQFAKRDNNKQAAPQQEKVVKLSRHAHVVAVALEILTPEYVKLATRDPQRIRIVRDTVLAYMRTNQIFLGKFKTTEFIESVLLNIGDEIFYTAVSNQLEKNLGVIL